jgi:hypothetical protein
VIWGDPGRRARAWTKTADQILGIVSHLDASVRPGALAAQNQQLLDD